PGPRPGAGTPHPTRPDGRRLQLPGTLVGAGRRTGPHPGADVHPRRGPDRPVPRWILGAPLARGALRGGPSARPGAGPRGVPRVWGAAVVARRLRRRSGVRGKGPRP